MSLLKKEEGLFDLGHRSKMTKGMTSFRKCHNERCCCCGLKASHLQKSTCGKCGYPTKLERKCDWRLPRLIDKTPLALVGRGS